jgi:acetyl esterase
MTLRARFERAAARAFVRLPAPLLRTLIGPPRRSPEGFELDLQIQALVWLMTLTQGQEMTAGGLARARRVMDRNGSLLGPPAGDVSKSDRFVPGAAGERRARVYRPLAAPAREAPALVWFHGGGFVFGSIESHDGICRGLASQSGAVVISVDYRLAPEHPFPAAVDDATAATKWILSNAGSLGLDPRAIAVGGDSAGGNLAAVVSLALRGSALVPAFQLLVYPATDFTRSEPSHKLFGSGLVLTTESMDWFVENYLPSASTHRDPRASPLFARDLTGLPPAFVLTAGFDPLRDEGRAYADRLREAGVVVEYVCAEGAVHGFANMAGSLREPSRVLGLLASRLRQGLSSAPPARA